jgi:O-antigen/teichoic acid export membrane protein
MELWKCVGTNSWASQGNLKGADGNGITDISKTSTSGLVDTYTITFDDGGTETFDVTNGADGQNGSKWYKGTAISGTGTSITGFPGVVNDFLDRILFRYFDTNAEAWRSSLGLYQAAVKLAVIMNLFIQMFRYAAEPFFFRQSREKGSVKLYADVQEYFTAFCGLVFLGVILYIDIIALILGPQFREAVGIVPIMLLSYMILGMLFNVSMWYKLSGKTNIAIWITLSGLAVTALVIVLFMPKCPATAT